MNPILSLLTDVTVDGFALWIVLLICVGVFLGSFMDAIAGGGGIITVPPTSSPFPVCRPITPWEPISSLPASAPCSPLPASLKMVW